MILVRNVSKNFDGIKALDGVTFEVERGETCAIIGPSGCGKSTLLLIMAGIIKPSEGEVKVDGRTVNSPLRNAALILQDFGLFSVEDSLRQHSSRFEAQGCWERY